MLGAPEPVLGLGLGPGRQTSLSPGTSPLQSWVRGRLAALLRVPEARDRLRLTPAQQRSGNTAFKVAFARAGELTQFLRSTFWNETMVEWLLLLFAFSFTH